MVSSTHFRNLITPNEKSIIQVLIKAQKSPYHCTNSVQRDGDYDE